MSNNDVSIRATAKAEIQELVQYVEQLNQADQALNRYMQTAQAASALGVASAGPGGASAPLGGIAMGQTAPDGTPPPATPMPVSPSAAPPPAPGGNQDPGRNPVGYDGGAGQRSAGSGGGGGGGQPRDAQGRFVSQGGGGGGGGGGGAGALAAGAMSGGVAGFLGAGLANAQAEAASQGFGERWGGRLGGVIGMLGGPIGSWIGKKVGGALGGMGDSAVSYAGRIGASAVQQGATLALGSSPSGFFMTSAQKYLELSKTITQVNARFQDLDGTAASFGGTLGYTIQRTAEMVNTLGESADRFTRADFQGYAGYARARGVDPGQAMGAFGEMQVMQGGIGLSRGQMAQIDLAARNMGMGQGGQGQALQLISRLAGRYLDQTGDVDIGSIAALTSLPRDIFDPGWRDDPSFTSPFMDPRARGARAEQFIGKVDSLLTSRSGAGGATMMRAMGYGTGDMDYIEMRRRQEEGLSNADNLADLMEYINARAPEGERGRGYRFRFLEALSQETGAGLNADEILAMGEAFNSQEKIDEYRRRRSVFGEDKAMEYLTADMSDKQRAAFAEKGYFGLGRQNISTGESVELRIESMMMQVGRPIAELIPSMQNTIESITKAMVNLADIDLGGSLTKIVKGVESTAKSLEMWSEKGADPMGIGSLKASSDQVRDIIQNPGQALKDAAGFGDSPITPYTAIYRFMEGPLPEGGSR